MLYHDKKRGLSWSKSKPPIENPATPPEKGFKCKKCNEKFRLKATLNNHVWNCPRRYF